jgi:hypothetical protein
LSVFDTYIGTTNGVFRLRDDALEALGLESERVSAIHAWHEGDAAVVLAGSHGNGLFRSADGGRAWSTVNAGLSASAFRILAPDPGHAGTLLAGTEPARIFRSEDGGLTRRELDGVTRIGGHERWFLPLFAAGRRGSQRVRAPRPRLQLLAAIEVAGLLRSDDDGRSWVCESVDGDEDLHHITAIRTIRTCCTQWAPRHSRRRRPTTRHATTAGSRATRRGEHLAQARNRLHARDDHPARTTGPPAGGPGAAGRPRWSDRRIRRRR